MRSTPTAVHLRPMAATDLARVHALEKMCFPTPWPLKSFRFELEENDVSYLWVAEHQPGVGQMPEVVGMIVVWLLVDEVHIATLAVDPRYRKQGIAARLLCTSLVHCLALGATSATLEVRESNIPAQRLYARFGFEQVGQRKGYYQDNGEDALLLTLHQLTETHLKEVGCSVL